MQLFLLRQHILFEARQELLRAMCLPAEDQALEDGSGHCVCVYWHWDRDTQRTPNGLVFADQHIDDHAVNRVVAAVVRKDAYRGARLTIAVHTAFALFVTGWAPRQVIVHDG